MNIFNQLSKIMIKKSRKGLTSRIKFVQYIIIGHGIVYLNQWRHLWQVLATVEITNRCSFHSIVLFYVLLSYILNLSITSIPELFMFRFITQGFYLNAYTISCFYSVLRPFEIEKATSQPGRKTNKHIKQSCNFIIICDVLVPCQI